MITRRAIRSPDRHRHLPLHRRRGLDEAAARARAPRHTRTRSPSIGGSCGRRSPRTAASRSTRRAMPSSSPSRLRRARWRPPRRTGELASGPIRVRIGIHTGTPLLTEEGYVGVDVHRAARIAACRPRRAGARLGLDRCARRARIGCATWASTGSRTCPRRSGSTSSGTATSRRSRASTGRTCPSRPRPSSVASDELDEVLELLSPRRRPPADADRAGRHGEDAARAAGGGRGVGRVTRTVSSGCRSLRFATRRSCSRPRRRRSGRRTAWPSTSATSDAAALRQLRARRGGGAPSSPACSPRAPTSTCS